MTLAVIALAAQVTLAPCPIEGVPGEARCGTYRVWENRETRQGRQIDLSIIVLPATGPNRQPDPFFMLISAFLERGSADGLERSCAAANPAPPFVLSGPSK